MTHSHGGVEHDHGDDDHHHGPAQRPGGPTSDTERAAFDLSIPDSELSPGEFGRRSFLRRAGLLGAAAAAVTMAGSAERAAAAGDVGDAPVVVDDPDGNRGGRPGRQFTWLAGDHHIHTQYSGDAQYRVLDQVQHGSAYGLDWMVITDHGSVTHAKIGVDKVNPDIVKARKVFGDSTLVFQGLEWNIPGAEHGTVFVHPATNEVAVLKEFENSFDGVVNGWTAATAENEAHALEGLDFLAASISSGRIKDAAFLANHPARKGLDSPHEIRAWRDRQPTVALGMEGAPGHQAAGIRTPIGAASGRGYYDNSPTADSFPAYPLESYITYGGFDWMTSTVGGLWDSLLAEGKTWWITANSDSHQIYLDESIRGGAGSTDEFLANGKFLDPIHGAQGPQVTFGDFWPGYYSKTHVGASAFGFSAVLNGIRAGRVYVDHGGLVGSVDVSVRTKGDHGPGSPLGSVLHPRKGSRLELAVQINKASLPNWAQFVPALARVDVIKGSVTGPASNRDTFQAPNTKVVLQRDVSSSTDTVEFTYDLGAVVEPFYVRVRGSDGKRGAVGLGGASVDPQGPAADVKGDADPWADLWFYTNPIWVIPR